MLMIWKFFFNYALQALKFTFVISNVSHFEMNVPNLNLLGVGRFTVSIRKTVSSYTTKQLLGYGLDFRAGIDKN